MALLAALLAAQPLAHAADIFIGAKLPDQRHQV